LKHLLAYLKPIQDRRKELASRPEEVSEIIAEGSRRARAVAQKTLAEVTEAMKL